MSAAAPARPAPDFAVLVADVKAAGLLRRRPGAYAARFVVNALLLGATATLFVVLGPSWWQLATAALLAVVGTQLAYVGHDAGHRQIAAGRRGNEIIGHLHGALVGMSFGTWTEQHNRHHAHPNHVDADPDIDIAVLAFTGERARASTGFVRWMIRHQAVLFLPLLLLEGWSLHVSALAGALHGRVRRPVLELALFAAHVVGYLVAVALVLTPLQAVAFVVVHQGLWGLHMGLAFAPNHKGMPTVGPDVRLDHLHKQVLTSRNVRGGPVLDVLLGGLNHQIEHHLFPRMPRPNLRRARPLVRAFCAEHDLPYTETSALRSYRLVLRHLREVGVTLSAPAPAAAGPLG